MSDGMGIPRELAVKAAALLRRKASETSAAYHADAVAYRECADLLDPPPPPPPPQGPERESNLRIHARRELSLAGLDQPDSDYDGMLAAAVLELITTFADQGHSGYSASLLADLFGRLARYEPLTPLTYAPDEWHRHEGLGPDGGDLWQNVRDSRVFSVDGGVTHYDVGGES